MRPAACRGGKVTRRLQDLTMETRRHGETYGGCTRIRTIAKIARIIRIETNTFETRRNRGSGGKTCADSRRATEKSQKTLATVQCQLKIGPMFVK
jgi:hypothetical protein